MGTFAGGVIVESFPAAIAAFTVEIAAALAASFVVA